MRPRIFIQDTAYLKHREIQKIFYPSYVKAKGKNRGKRYLYVRFGVHHACIYSVDIEK